MTPPKTPTPDASLQLDEVRRAPTPDHDEAHEARHGDRPEERAHRHHAVEVGEQRQDRGRCESDRQQAGPQRDARRRALSDCGVGRHLSCRRSRRPPRRTCLRPGARRRACGVRASAVAARAAVSAVGPRRPGEARRRAHRVAPVGLMSDAWPGWPGVTSGAWRPAPVGVTSGAPVSRRGRSVPPWPGCPGVTSGAWRPAPVGVTSAG